MELVQKYESKYILIASRSPCRRGRSRKARKTQPESIAETPPLDEMPTG